MHETSVGPNGKRLPDAGTHSTRGAASQRSAAVTTKSTVAPSGPVHSAVMSPGHVMSGGVVSTTVTFRHPSRSADELHAHLQAARIDVALCLGALRVSPGTYNDGADVQALLETLP